MRCNSRSCSSCFPPNEGKQTALQDALDRLDYATKTADDVLGWNSDEYWNLHDQPWFQALLAAYNAGVLEARSVVESELEKYK